MNGWLLVRIAGIVVGIATLLRVATNEGMVTYDPLFLAWMDWLSDIVELGFLTKLIGPFLHWGIDQVRSLGISVPDLQDEWRPAFILSMLMFGAISRHSRSHSWLLAAPIGALAIGVVTGLTGTILVPVVAFAIVTLLVAVAPAFTITLAFAFTVAAVITCVLLAAVIPFLAAIDPAFALLFADVNFMAFFPAFAGIMLLLHGISQSRAEGWRAVLANRPFNVAIDILGVMLGALGLASLFANPPIW
jgi:hypothetical protein